MRADKAARRKEPNRLAPGPKVDGLPRRQQQEIVKERGDGTVGLGVGVGVGVGVGAAGAASHSRCWGRGAEGRMAGGAAGQLSGQSGGRRTDCLSRRGLPAGNSLAWWPGGTP